MPPVSIKYVVSFSSQDDKHPVNNLTSGDGFRKWLSHPQERSGHMEAVFQLEQPCVISYIDIGSIWCASLEVQVGLSSWPVGQPYETLAHTVTLMSPTDCTQGKNTTSTKMFSSELFCPGVADQEWDRMKVICRQPYKKLNQFGLSFIRVKTSVQTKSVTEATPKQDSETPTLKSIQNHFFSRPTNGLPAGQARLTGRLLKIAGSAENGTEHGGSLSRTARLVLAASGPRQGLSPHGKPTIEQKDGPTFKEDVEEFLASLKIERAELDSITLADLRHRLERKKQRKLTKEEKRTFIKMASEFVQLLFAKEGENIQTTETPDTNTKVAEQRKNLKDMSSKNNSTSVNKKFDMSQMLLESRKANDADENQKQCSDKRPLPAAKRKLSSNHLSTPPPKKFLTENTICMQQQLKSTEGLTNDFVTNDLVDSTRSFITQSYVSSLKRSPLEVPVSNTSDSCVRPAAFQYKGLRGLDDLDLDSQDLVGSPPLTRTAGQVDTLSPNSVTSSPSKHKHVEPINDTSIGVPWSPIINADTSFMGCTSGLDSSTPKGRRAGRGRSRGRGRGRGSRGRGQQKVDTSINLSIYGSVDLDVLSDDEAWFGGNQHLVKDLDVVSSPIRGRGRKRGRGRGRGSRGGKTAKADNSELVPGPIDVACSPVRACPRGFARCDGCKEYFGEALLSNHQQRCVSWKSRQTGSSSTPESPWSSRGRGSSPGKRKVDTSINTSINNVCGSVDLDVLSDDVTWFGGNQHLVKDLDVVSSPIRGQGHKRGRGRGRGSRGGKTAKADNSELVPGPIDVACSPVRACPRGFARCDGCKEYFGEASLSNHQKRCVAWKSRQTASSSTPESPWLTTRPVAVTPKHSVSTPRRKSTVPPVDVSYQTPGSTAGDKVVSNTRTCTSSVDTAISGADSGVRSPPWLLAAEQRLASQVRGENNPKPRSEGTTAATDRHGDTTSSDVLDLSSHIIEKHSNTEQSHGSNNENQFGNFIMGNNSIDLTLTDDTDDGDDISGDSSDDITDEDAVYEPNPHNADTAVARLDDTTIHVECPLCGDFYPSFVVALHAASCQL